MTIVNGLGSKQFDEEITFIYSEPDEEIYMIHGISYLKITVGKIAQKTHSVIHYLKHSI